VCLFYKKISPACDLAVLSKRLHFSTPAEAQKAVLAVVEMAQLQDRLPKEVLRALKEKAHGKTALVFFGSERPSGCG
jgi:hypothetical protein